MTKPCATCGKSISGATQKRFCATCRKARYRKTVRYLGAGERVPEDEPKRYLASHGYMRLRWRVGPYEYVETYEHRVSDGRVVTEDQVHHANRDRADNRRENLHAMSTEDHALEHAEIGWWAVAARLYGRGMSTYQVGERLNRDASTVYRALSKMGVPLRKEARIAIPNRERQDD